MTQNKETLDPEQSNQLYIGLTDLTTPTPDASGDTFRPLPTVCGFCKGLDGRHYRDCTCPLFAKPGASHTKEKIMTEEQIKYMVDRFLWWRLPKDFNPDCGIHFDAEAAKKLNSNNEIYEPTGTNLFHIGQAEAMVWHMLEGMPPAPADASVEALVGKLTKAAGQPSNKWAEYISLPTAIELVKQHFGGKS